VGTDKKKEAYGYLRYSRFLIRYRCKLKLSDQECMVILSVMNYANNQMWDRQHPFPSNKAVADKMGCSERKVHTYSARLKSKGLLNRKEGGSKPEWDFTNLYNKLDSFNNQTTHNQDSTTQDTETTRQHESKTTQVKGTTSHGSAPEVTKEVIEEVNNKEKRSKENISTSFNNSKLDTGVTTGSNGSIDPELIKSAKHDIDWWLYDQLKNADPSQWKKVYRRFMINYKYESLLSLPQFNPEKLDLEKFYNIKKSRRPYG